MKVCKKKIENKYIFFLFMSLENTENTSKITVDKQNNRW